MIGNDYKLPELPEPPPFRSDVRYGVNALKNMADNAKETVKVLEQERLQMLSDLDSDANIRDSFERALGRFTALGSTILSISNNMCIALLGGRYNSFWTDERRAPEWCFQAVVKDNRLLVKLPPLPIAPYRSSWKASPAIRALRFPQLAVMLEQLPTLDVTRYDNITLFLLHVIPQDYDSRKTPDFDNYDVKGTIDTILSAYGGDGPFCYTLVHRTVRAGLLASGTYALLCNDLDCFSSHQQVMSLLAEQFPFDQYAEHEPDYSSLRKQLSEPVKPFIPAISDDKISFDKHRSRNAKNTRL